MKTQKNIHDLISDPTFIQWLRHPESEGATTWEEWALTSSENTALAEEAAAMIKGIPFVEKKLSEETITRQWEQLAVDLQLEPAVSEPPVHRLRKILLIAAAIGSLIIAGGLAYWYLQPSYLEYQTAYGERLEIALPDGSRLTLNANSKAGFYQDLHRRSIREVDLRGEAFFTVTPLPDQRPFQVHAGDLTVQVLGTSFNVHSRKGPTVVSLVSGKVRLRTPVGAEQVLAPGASAWYDDLKEGFVIEPSGAANRSSWVEQRWVFEEPVSFRTVLEQVSDLYGLTWELADPALLDKELSGSIAIESKEVLLNSLSLALDVEIIETGNQKILIKE